MTILLRTAVLALIATASQAQSLRLEMPGHPAGEPIRLLVGEQLRIDLIADLQDVRAAGLATYVTLPEGVFDVQDQGLDGQSGTQPFRLGEMFAGAQIPTNRLLPDSDPVAAASPGQQLDLAVLFGLGVPSRPAGTGVVASLELTARQASSDVVIRIDDSPIRETKLVLADGVTERRFARTDDLPVTVIDPIASAVVASGWARMKQVAAP